MLAVHALSCELVIKFTLAFEALTLEQSTELTLNSPKSNN